MNLMQHNLVNRYEGLFCYDMKRGMGAATSQWRNSKGEAQKSNYEIVSNARNAITLPPLIKIANYGPAAPAPF